MKPATENSSLTETSFPQTLSEVIATPASWTDVRETIVPDCEPTASDIDEQDGGSPRRVLLLGRRHLAQAARRFDGQGLPRGGPSDLLYQAE